MLYHLQSGLFGLLTGGLVGLGVVVGGNHAGNRVRSLVLSGDIVKHPLTRMYLTAACTSCAGILLGKLSRNTFGGFHDLSLYLKPRRMMITAIGGFFMGTGMWLSDSDPTIIFSQLGAFTQGTLWVILGQLAGTFVYGMLHPFLIRRAIALPDRILTLDKALLAPIQKTGSFWDSWKLVAACFITTSASALSATFSNDHSATLGGAIIGSIQFPSFWLSRAAFGTSTALVTVVGHALSLFTQPNDYFRSCMFEPKRIWQVMLDIGIGLGTFLILPLFEGEQNTSLSSTASLPSPSYGLYRFIGGFLSSFGSRLADGCTAGHLVSGISMLSSHSFIFLCATAFGAVSARIWFPSPR